MEEMAAAAEKKRVKVAWRSVVALRGRYSDIFVIIARHIMAIQ